MKRLAPLLALGAMLACSGDGPNSPGIKDVTGVWQISFSHMFGNGVICDSDVSTMTLTMSGSTFSGGYGPMTLTCTGGTSPFQDTLQGMVVNGLLGINDVSFDLDSPDFHQSGDTRGCLPGECTVPPEPRPNSMSGMANWRIEVGGQITVFTGIWSAFKAP